MLNLSTCHALVCRTVRLSALFYVAHAFLLMGIWGLATIILIQPQVAWADLNCAAEQQIHETFENGASWHLCWESRLRENIVLTEVGYQASGSSNVYPVLSSIRLSQLHVAYDDSEVTYNDVTQFGLGAAYVATLNESDCPGGELKNIQGRAGLCLLRSTGFDVYRVADGVQAAESFKLFSISQVGSYAYLITWTFFSNGAIEPSVGAAGALQRAAEIEKAPYGRVLDAVQDKVWLSHTHNYYWRMDFDLGESSEDDQVIEINVTPNKVGMVSTQRERLERESARSVSPETSRAWLVRDGADELAPGYLIEPVHYGHKLDRKAIEPYTEFDFFVSKQSDCERFISENAKYFPDCSENILQFLNDESIVHQDIVLWHRIAFHHVPRNEDVEHMHSHWDGFVMQPSNIGLVNDQQQRTLSSSLPIAATLLDRESRVGERLDGELLMQTSLALLTFSATGLPAGVALAESGELRGSATHVGEYRVVVRISNSVASVSSSFTWTVKPAQRPSAGCSAVSLGSFSNQNPFVVWLLLGVFLLRIKRQLKP